MISKQQCRNAWSLIVDFLLILVLLTSSQEMAMLGYPPSGRPMAGDRAVLQTKLFFTVFAFSGNNCCIIWLHPISQRLYLQLSINCLLCWSSRFYIYKFVCSIFNEFTVHCIRKMINTCLLALWGLPRSVVLIIMNNSAV